MVNLYETWQAKYSKLYYKDFNSHFDYLFIAIYFYLIKENQSLYACKFFRSLVFILKTFDKKLCINLLWQWKMENVGTIYHQTLFQVVFFF